jgi:predicted RNase H-like nuclease (RuvC/YqgF family)
MFNSKEKNRSAYSFRLNSEFSFKERFDTGNKENSKRFNQTSGNFHTKIKINKSDQGIQDVVSKLYSLRTSREKLNKLMKDEDDHVNCKEDEINIINQYVEELSSSNEELVYQMSRLTKERTELEHQQREIADYCNDLKRKFANFEQTVIIYIIFKQPFR